MDHAGLPRKAPSAPVLGARRSAISPFMDGVSAERIDAAHQIHSLCLEHLSGSYERMQWPMCESGQLLQMS